ncbi:MAG: phage tail tube protein [Methanoregula sp.]|jgi:predicted secreted protein
MTASTAERGYGATLAKGATAIAEITDYSDVGISRSDVEITSHDSDSSANEYLPGLREGSEITITGNYIYNDTGQNAAITDFSDGSLDEYTITFPNAAASTFVFYAYIKSYKIKSDLKGALKITLVLKISGLPVFTV